jgi:hypothetical protein
VRGSCRAEESEGVSWYKVYFPPMTLFRTAATAHYVVLDYRPNAYWSYLSELLDMIGSCLR